MPKSSNQKLKLLYLMKIFMERTDEDHTLTVPNLIELLSQYNIEAERKTIYDDIEALKHFGLDIMSRKTKTYDYFLASREFELPEVKLLTDAVASSKFITEKKSNELIKKIESLTSIYQARKLQRQVYVTNRVKTMNEKIYYNVDTIHEAIADNKMIAFKYFEYTVDKQKRYKNNGENYHASPYALSWDDENYYLIAHYDGHEGITHFRVDKMESIEILSKDRYRVDKKEEFNLAAYSKKVFNMFSGEEESVELLFNNSLVGVVIDRFGKEVNIIKKDDEHFIVWLNIVVSPTFLAWVFQFGDRVKILSPKSCVNKMKERIKEQAEIYK